LSPGTYVTATAEADVQAVAAPVPVPDTEPVPDTTPMPDVGPATQPALPATGVTPWPTMGWTLTLLTVGLVLVVAARRRRAPF
jgi:hypothetical protein